MLKYPLLLEDVLFEAAQFHLETGTRMTQFVVSLEQFDSLVVSCSCVGAEGGDFYIHTSSGKIKIIPWP